MPFVTTVCLDRPVPFSLYVNPSLMSDRPSLTVIKEKTMPDQITDKGTSYEHVHILKIVMPKNLSILAKQILELSLVLIVSKEIKTCEDPMLLF
jgi:hypothetical protein